MVEAAAAVLVVLGMLMLTLAVYGMATTTCCIRTGASLRVERDASGPVR